MVAVDIVPANSEFALEAGGRVARSDRQRPGDMSAAFGILVRFVRLYTAGRRLGTPCCYARSAAPHVEPTLRFCLILSIVLMVLGFAAPKRLRLTLVLGGFASAWFFMALPVAI